MRFIGLGQMESAMERDVQQEREKKKYQKETERKRPHGKDSKAHKKMEAEIVVMWPQVEECLEPQELEEGR